LGAFPINNPAPTMTSISPTSSPSGNQLIPLFLSDGTAAIKDAVHDIPATLTGTPTTASLMGVTAPVISPSAYTSQSFPTASLGLTPGMPISMVFAVNTAWSGDDGQTHMLIENYADADNYFLLEKHSWNTLFLRVGSAGGAYKQKTMDVDATNWAAETDHVIVVTISADNTQRLWLDGCEAYQESGDDHGVRETALAANTYFGCDAQWDGYNLLDGSGLFAIYEGILTDAEIDTINAGLGAILTASWSDTGFPASLDFMGLVPDGAGNIYVAGMDGPSTVWVYDGATWTDTGGPVFTKDPLYADPANVAVVDPLVFDSTGILYAAVKYCGVYSFDGTTWVKLTGSPADPYALLYEPTQNVLWVGMTNTGVWKYDIEAGTWTDTELKENGNYLLSALALAWDDAHDLLYVATNWDGVWVYDGATWTDTGGIITTRPWTYDGPLAADVEALVYNADDDLLYLATDTFGILKYDGATWTSAERYVSEHWWEQIFNIIYDSTNGFLYTGTAHSGLWRCSPPAADWARIQGVDAFTVGGWENYMDDPAFNTFGIVRMCFDGTTLYVATWGNGIWKTDVSTFLLSAMPDWTTLPNLVSPQILTSISPTSVTAGSPDLPVTLVGSDFELGPTLTSCLSADSSLLAGRVTRRYNALLSHYEIEGDKIQAGEPHENGDIEQAHFRLKEAVDQALMLRESRDFSSVEEYKAFLKAIIAQRNAGRRARQSWGRGPPGSCLILRKAGGGPSWTRTSDTRIMSCFR